MKSLSSLTKELTTHPRTVPTVSKGRDHRTRDTCHVPQLQGPCLGVLPSPPGQVLAHLSLSSYSSLPQSLKSSAAMGTALASGRLGVGEGTQSVGLLRPQAQREEEVTKSGFQWMPETTLKRVLRHCECSPASLCPPTAELGTRSPGRPSTRTRPSLRLTPRCHH